MSWQSFVSKLDAELTEFGVVSDLAQKGADTVQKVEKWWVTPVKKKRVVRKKAAGPQVKATASPISAPTANGVTPPPLPKKAQPKAGMKLPAGLGKKALIGGGIALTGVGAGMAIAKHGERKERRFAALDLGKKWPRFDPCIAPAVMDPEDRIDYPSLWLSDLPEAPKLGDSGKAVITYKVTRQSTETHDGKTKHSLRLDVKSIEQVKKAAKELAAGRLPVTEFLSVPGAAEVLFGGRTDAVVNAGRRVVGRAKLAIDDVTGTSNRQWRDAVAESNEGVRKARHAESKLTRQVMTPGTSEGQRALLKQDAERAMKVTDEAVSAQKSAFKGQKTAADRTKKTRRVAGGAVGTAAAGTAGVVLVNRRERTR